MLDFSRWKIFGIILICLASLVFAAPNLVPEARLLTLREALPTWVPTRQVNLGLDLRGGSHLMLGVDTKAVFKQEVEKLEDTVRTELRGLKNAQSQRVGYGAFRIDARGVSFVVRSPKDVDQVVEAMRTLSRPVGDSLSGIRDIEVTVLDQNRVHVTLTEPGVRDRIALAVAQSIEVVRRRIDEMGTREPTIVRQGDDRIVVQVPGLQDPAALKNVLGQTAKLSFHLVADVSEDQRARGRAPAGVLLLPSVDAQDGIVAIERRSRLSGEDLVDAQASYSQGEAVVSFRFNARGGRIFGDLTGANVGKPFAIVLDNKVISAPRINEPILGGSGIISGRFTAESANQLAILLRSGALPAPLEILEERTVGPDLGSDSVRAGTLAALAGCGAVLVLMAITYGLFGLFANIALILNVAMIFALLTVTGATLTLPGIAGLVLTVGAAVDANILIFERIREELRHGRTVVSAMETGYREASRTIWDANVTNLIAAALMFWFGSGPIKGFAVVLTFGIVTSVFTAVTVCRLLTVWWLKRASDKARVQKQPLALVL